MIIKPPNKSRQLLVLVDGSSFLFSAYHAIPPLSNALGEPTHAIYGVVNMLRKLMDNHRTKYIAVVFDAPGKTFRHKLYSKYKANRPPMPDDLKVQIKPLHNLILAMGLPMIMETEVEADDVLGSLAKRAVKAGFNVVISTVDKDMAQLVSEHITLENTLSKTTMDRDGVVNKFGVKPEQIVDYLALMGDASDNIPGVLKVGPKTARKWLGDYETIANLIKNAEQIKGKVGINLRASLQQLSLYRELTTIKSDLDLPHTMDDLKYRGADLEKLKSQLTNLGFTTWLNALSNLSVGDKTQQKIDTDNQKKYATILTQEEFAYWLKRLNQAPLVVLAVATTSLNYIDAEIIGIAFASSPNVAAYIPLAHDYADIPKQLNREIVLNSLKSLLENPNQPKLGHNLKYISQVLANYGIQMQGIQYDTMLESYLYNSIAQHNLSSLAKTYLGLETISYEAIVGKGVRQISFAQVPLKQASAYVAEITDITLKLHKILLEKLKSCPSLEKLYREVEIPLIPALSSTERHGVLIDAQMLGQQSLKLASHIIDLEQKAYDLVGQVFNLDSPKQIQEILYTQQKLPVLKKTPNGIPSTAEPVLQELARDHLLPELILEYRGIRKLKSTYTDKLPLQINPKTNRVHTSYHQAVTATGRLSSANPNLQNIPIRSVEGRKIRQAFIAPEKYKLIAADYSQIELRIMTHLSSDESLLAAFAKSVDIHSVTAAEVFSVSIDQVTADLRRSAKAINFGLIYGMSAFGLARQLNISRSKAQSYINFYFSRYPGVKKYMDDTRKMAIEQGYVETLFGRRLYLPELKSSNVAHRKYAERAAINAPMQGTAADIIKIAMLNIDKWLKETDSNNKIIMQVHDELVFEVDENQVKSFADNIKKIMCSVTKLDVPLVVNIGKGYNWNDAH